MKSIKLALIRNRPSRRSTWKVPMRREWVSGGRHAVVAIATSMIVFLAATSAFAQAVGTAAIRGRVVDQSGAGVPGVTVTISSPALQLRERSGVTEGNGEFQPRS